LPGAVHDGTEGELYSLADDPLQQVNRWDDPAVRALRDDLLDDLRTSQPAPRRPRLPIEAPV
ncbi:MAG: sulfatase family protein, partial [Acidimicrobiales bacterium]